MNLKRSWVFVAVLLCCCEADNSFGQSGSRRTRTVRRRPTPTSVANEPVRLVLPRAPLAADGMDVVAMSKGSLVQGVEQLHARFDGQTYRFESADSKATFESSPERFAPALGGASVVELINEQRLENGNPKFATVHDGRLFLFSSQAEKETFEKNPAKFPRCRPSTWWIVPGKPCG